MNLVIPAKAPLLSGYFLLTGPKDSSSGEGRDLGRRVREIPSAIGMTANALPANR